MKKGYLYVIIGLTGLWLQYFLMASTEWVKSGRYAPPLPQEPIFWPLTITLWVIMFTLSYYLSIWRGAK